MSVLPSDDAIAMDFLLDIEDGKAKPADPTCTNLDVCLPKTADTCVGGGR